MHGRKPLRVHFEGRRRRTVAERANLSTGPVRRSCVVRMLSADLDREERGGSGDALGFDFVTGCQGAAVDILWRRITGIARDTI